MAAAKKLSKMEQLRISVGDKADESMGASRLKANPPPVAIRRRDPRWDGISPARDVATIEVDRIGPDPDQPRKDFDPESLERLAESLKAHGQFQPIRVRWVEAIGRYVVVSGERRWRAATLAGLESLTCVMVDGETTPEQLLADQLIENCLREDLAPMELADAYAVLMDRTGWTQTRLARELNVGQPSISKAIALRSLPEAVRARVISGELSPAIAREMGRIEDQERLSRAMERAIAEGWTVPEATFTVRKILAEIEAESHPGGASPNSFGYSSRNNSGPEVAQDHGMPGLDGPLIGDPEAFLEAARDARGEPSPPIRVPSKALPDWRDRPAMGLGFSDRLTRLLADSEIESAGEAWGLLESGALVDPLGWTVNEAKLLEKALVELRREAGDPDPFLRPLAPAAPRTAEEELEGLGFLTPLPRGISGVSPAPGEGRDVPGKSREGAVRIVEPARDGPGPEWGQNPFTPERRLVLAEAEGVAIWAIAGRDAADIRVLTALRDAVALVEAMLGI